MNFKILIFSAAALLSLASCKQPVKKLIQNETKAPAKVSVMYVSAAQDLATNTYIGTVKASKSVRIAAKYPGLVEQVAVRQGSKVAKGDLLAVISSETVESTLASAEATYALAKDGLARAKQVYASGAISEQKYISIQTDYARAEAAVKAARAAKEDCTLRAPFDGVVGEVSVEVNENAQAFATVATVLDIQTLEIEISVPEKEISALKEGSKMQYKVAALQPDATFAASVKSKAVTASILSHSYACTLSLVTKPQGLLPGMVCNVYSQMSDNQNLTVIPSTIVRTDSCGRYVWIVENGKVQRRYITVGGYSGSGVVVTEGLREGDAVIAAGSGKFSEGEEVVVE